MKQDECREEKKKIDQAGKDPKLPWEAQHTKAPRSHRAKMKN